MVRVVVRGLLWGSWNVHSHILPPPFFLFLRSFAPFRRFLTVSLLPPPHHALVYHFFLSL